MVSGLVEYDSLGRAVFEARPFSAAEAPHVPNGPHAGYGTTRVFDRRGRLLRTVAAHGRDDVSESSSVAADRFVTTFEYGYQDGKAVAIRRGPDETDPTSARVMHRDVSLRTALGREVERARFSPSGERLDLVRQRWDRLGRIEGIDRFADPATGNVPVSWNSRHDSLGRRLSLTEPGMSTRFTSYDEVGNPIESWWDEGVQRHITRTRYDGFGRMTDRQLLVSTSGDEQLASHDRFHYDDHSGEPEQASDDYWGRLSWSETLGVGKVFQGYDEFGRTSATSYLYESEDGKKLVREVADFTAPGRLRSLSLETASTTDQFNYRYDSAGRVVEVLDDRGRGYWLARSIDFDGHVAQVELGNGVIETFERAPDGRREPLSWAAATSQGTYRYENVAFDAAGRVTEELLETPTSLDELRSHEFDSLGRLTRSFHINGGWGGSEHYTHDPLGNLISRTATTGIGDRAYQPDVVDPDRLCRFALPGSSGPCTFTYDGMGNVVSDSTYGPMFERAFKYDPADRVTSIQRASYGAIFTYGPSGRVHTAIDGVDDRDSWSFGDLVEEHRKGADAFMERRIVGPLGIIATLRHSEREDTIVYTHGDGRANRFFTDDQGDVVQAAEYTTYGQASQTGGTDPLKTTDDLWNGGDDIPELGIVLLGPRVYDPDLGRFLQRDPIAITSRSSLANPYAFSFSDPVNHADPSGLMPTVYASTSWNAAAGRWVAGAAIGFMAAGSLWPQMPDLSLNAAFGVDDAVVSHVGGTLRQGWSGVLDPVGAAERCGAACLQDDWLNDALGAVGGQQHRILGAARVAGGYATAQAGAALLAVPGAEGVGVFLIAVGTDQAAAGATSVIFNAPQRSLANAGATELVGQTWADRFEAGVLGATSAGTIAATQARSQAVVVGSSVAAEATASSGAAQAFAGLSRAGDHGIRPYGQLRTALQGTGLQAHHLIEQRFAAVMGQNARQMLSVAVTPAEHQVFTNAWRRLIPYGQAGTRAATRESVTQAARQIYADQPTILRALGL